MKNTGPVSRFPMGRGRTRPPDAFSPASVLQRVRRPRSTFAWVFLCVLLPAAAFATGNADAPEVAFVDALPLYTPAAKVSGTIRLWGHGSTKHDFMGRLMDAWIAG